MLWKEILEQYIQTKREDTMQHGFAIIAAQTDIPWFSAAGRYRTKN